MPEQLLDGAQVGAALQEMRCERMPERMRTDAALGGEAIDVLPEQAIDAPPGQPRAAIVDEQRIARLRCTAARRGALGGTATVLRLSFRSFRPFRPFRPFRS